MVTQEKMHDKMHGPDPVDFTPLFYPRTMAVIGASKNPVGAVKYVKAHKDTGIEVFPVNKNPDLDEIEGLKVYHSVLDIEKDIDLAIIGVPKEFVPPVIREFKEKTIHFAVIFTSGFEESGNDLLQSELLSAIKSVPTRFIGPNCLGIYHPKAQLVYFPGYPTGMEHAGNIAFIGQSGGHTAKTISYCSARKSKFSKAISIGNSVDLAPQDFLPYFKIDDDTSVIGFYLESTNDGRALMNALEDITPVKPVIIWKGGQGSVGIQATATHTGKLAGNYRMWQEMCKQTGTILSEDFDTFCDLLTMFSFKIPPPASRRIAVIACGGGNAVEATDILESSGMIIPELKRSTQQKILEVVPDVNTATRNPVDLGEYGYMPSKFAQALKVISDDENIDSIIYIKESERFPAFSVNFLMSHPEYESKMVSELLNAHEYNQNHRNIPMYLNDPYLAEDMDSFSCRISFRDKMIVNGIPTFPRIDILVNAISKVHGYAEWLKKKKKR